MVEYPFMQHDQLTMQLDSRFTLVRIYHQLCVVQLQRMLTHETNNALTGLSGYAQMALRLRKEETYLKAAEAFNEGLAALQRQQQHVNFFAREAPDELNPMDPMVSIRMVSELLTNYLSKRNIRLDIRVEKSGVIDGNPVLLGMVVLSCVWDAAGRILQEGGAGRLQISLHRQDNRVCLHFRDSARQPWTLRPQTCSATLSLADTSDLRFALASPTLAIIAGILGGHWSSTDESSDRELVLTIPCLRPMQGSDRPSTPDSPVPHPSPPEK
ncbi:MAG: HAMP domain-containing histidine kinase [Acidobacteria bacterium]|nr:HAMP domain-containing histidine kinase [Acidobacteriota bacterium]